MDNSILPEYLLSEEDYNELWRDCIFIMDSSAIFNVYRYSSNLRNEVKKILDTISARLWIPYQVAYEYHDNLESVINEEVQRYSKIMDSISKIQKPGRLELDDNLRRKHTPHYDLISYLEKRINDIESEFENHLQEIEKDTRKIGEKCPKKVELAEINALIHSYFNGKVGKPYSILELEKIVEIGDKRYDLLLPPGYEDRKDKKGLKIYGDLIIWHQIIEMAKDRKVHVIFICDDLKEDWWWKSSSRSTIGPRPELIQEFHSETNKLFWMYSLDRFLKYASKYIDVKIDEKVIDEAGEYRIEEEERLKRFESLSDFLRAYPGISEYHSEPSLYKEIAEAISRAYSYQDALRSVAESMNPNQDALRSLAESMKPYQEMWKFSPLLHQNLHEKSDKQPNSHDADESEN